MENRVKQCHLCTKKCPQEEMASEIAKGRMYATDEVIRLQKELEEVRNQTINEFVMVLNKELFKWADANHRLSRTVYDINNSRVAKAYENAMLLVDEVAKQMQVVG